MHISLTENLEAMVKAKVDSGLYTDASEVIREALRLMHARDQAEQERYTEFKRLAELGYEQARRGEFSTRTPDEIEQAIETKHHGA